MPVHRISDEIEIPVPLDEAWSFFSNPNNLQKLTPESMNFKQVYQPESEEVYPGMMLVYKVSPLLGIPLEWVTEIVQVDRKARFVDDQVKGPFAMWHHIHEFEERGSSTLVRDLLYYRMPFGPFGSIAHALFAKKQIHDIFEFRKEGLRELFP